MILETNETALQSQQQILEENEERVKKIRQETEQAKECWEKVQIDKDKAQDYKQNNYVAGVQWWFYPKCRLQAQYTYCDPHKGDSSNLLQAQLQVRF